MPKETVKNLLKLLPLCPPTPKAYTQRISPLFFECTCLCHYALWCTCHSHNKKLYPLALLILKLPQKTKNQKPKTHHTVLMKHDLSLSENLKFPPSSLLSKNPWSLGHQSLLTHHPIRHSHLLEAVTMSQAYGKVAICEVPLGSLKTSGKMPSLLRLLPSILRPCQIIPSCASVCPYSISYAHLACSCPAQHPPHSCFTSCTVSCSSQVSSPRKTARSQVFSCLRDGCREKNLITGDNLVI